LYWRALEFLEHGFCEHNRQFVIEGTCRDGPHFDSRDCASQYCEPSSSAHFLCSEGKNSDITSLTWSQILTTSISSVPSGWLDLARTAIITALKSKQKNTQLDPSTTLRRIRVGKIYPNFVE